MPRKVWTPERDAALRELFPAVGAGECARRMGLSLFGVKARAGKLGVRGDRTRRRVWTADLDARLREVVGAGRGIPAAARLLGLSRAAVKNRAFALGLRTPPREWAAAELDLIRREYATGMTAAEIAARLGRGVPAVRRRAHLLGVASGRTWTAAEKEVVRAGYATRGCRALALELLGSAGQLHMRSVYNLAQDLGVTTPVRHPPGVYERVRDLHAGGLNDRQIAAEMRDVFRSKNAREQVTSVRSLRLGLPAHRQTYEQRRAMGAAGRAKQIAAGVNPRDAAFARFAAAYGLPPDTPPRAVEILVCLAAGPRTRAGIRGATGADPVNLWNREGTSYLAGLARRGWVAAAPIPGASNRGPRVLYTLTPAAVALLAEAKEQS